MDLIRVRILTLLLALGCALVSQAAAEEAPPTGDAAAEPAKKAFAVLKILRGHEITYEAVALPEKKSRQDEVRKDARKAVEDWEATRTAFLNDKSKRGEPFLDRKPEPATVTTDREFVTLEEAKAWAEERQRKADGDFAIVEIKDTQGATELKIIYQKKFNAMREDQRKDFEKENAAYKKGRTDWYNNPSNRQQTGRPPPNDWEWRAYTTRMPERPDMSIRKADIETKEEAEKLLAEMKKGGSK